MNESSYTLLSKEFTECLFSFNRKFFCQTSLPLPVNHFITLASLHDDPCFSISALSKHLNISKQQMTPIIDKLLKNGYVSKQVLSEDRRCSSLSLTEKGYTLLKEHSDEHVKNFERLISVLSSSEIKELDNSLNTLKKLFGKMFAAQP